MTEKKKKNFDDNYDEFMPEISFDDIDEITPRSNRKAPLPRMAREHRILN